jgi:hypothetical protein
VVVECVWGKKDGDGGGERLYGGVKMRGKKENSDIKIGHVRPKYECIRMYVGAFERTCAECVCVKWALRSNVKGTFERIRASVCVCVMRHCGRTHATEFVHNPVSTF